jgi:predicted SprT family Zn-dependent metalloprotease
MKEEYRGMRMNLKQANKISKRLSSQYGIINPPVVQSLPYSRMGKKAILGCYDNHANLIKINKYVLEMWNTQQITDTIKHELMHARCYQDFGHGGHGKQFGLLCDLCELTNDIKRAIKRPHVYHINKKALLEMRRVI